MTKSNEKNHKYSLAVPVIIARRRQVPPVLKLTFKFRILTHNVLTVNQKKPFFSEKAFAEKKM